MVSKANKCQLQQKSTKIYQTKNRIIKQTPKKNIKSGKSTWLRHPRKELAALALKPGRAKALRRQLQMF
uniref:Uncharacterized protein n=1 Tax=Hordeum vulgare subsp. vulgare TaxID=112509 RepID=A0A8I6XSI7_HORVV